MSCLSIKRIYNEMMYRIVEQFFNTFIKLVLSYGLSQSIGLLDTRHSNKWEICLKKLNLCIVYRLQSLKRDNSLRTEYFLFFNKEELNQTIRFVRFRHILIAVIALLIDSQTSCYNITKSFSLIELIVNSLNSASFETLTVYCILYFHWLLNLFRAYYSYRISENNQTFINGFESRETFLYV